MISRQDDRTATLTATALSPSWSLFPLIIAITASGIRSSACRAPEIRQAWLSSQTVESLQKLRAGLDRAQQVGTESDSAVAGRWRASSASLLSSLEQLLSRKGTCWERDFLRRGLATRFSSDLLKRIQAITLNTTRLVLQLRPYQEFGAKFAVAACRGLLGDDMGLSKTVQALAAIAHATEADGERHHVVVCPASLIDTWLQEIRRTLAGIEGWRFHGVTREAEFRDWQGAGGILVTSFQQAEHLPARNHSPIGFVVVDEAHAVKNQRHGGRRSSDPSPIALAGYCS